ncbi:MAG: hypothetical protein JSV64_08860 [Candidatus Bathyarchaeota archaeon]|nr:MAG: hypothetical protein JSV64_08860 [Candidatus Bathyarchaeota archaeon]
MMSNERGQMRTVEAFLSILLLFSAFAVATSISPSTDPRPDDSLTSVGMQALISLDGNGELGRLIDDRNWTRLTETVSALLPVSICYNLSIYDENMQLLNDACISNGALIDLWLVSTRYPCASPSPSGDIYSIRLQLATAR